MSGAQLTTAKARGKVVKVKTLSNRATVYMTGDLTWDAIVELKIPGIYEKRYTVLYYDETGLPAATVGRLLVTLLLGYATGEVRVVEDEVYVGYYFGKGIDAKVAIYYFKNADKTFVVTRCGAVHALGKRSEVEYNAKLAFEDEPELLKVVEEFLKALP